MQRIGGIAALGVAALVVAFATGYLVRGTKAAGAAEGQRGVFPVLNAAAMAHLSVVSTGVASGNPEQAASLSTGQVAIRDAANARSSGAQKAAGDTVDYAFDVINLDAHPLDGGTSDFIAFESIREHATGVRDNLFEVYHRDSTTGPWRAMHRVYLATNLEPSLFGSGHLLSTQEANIQHDQPDDVARRYATVMSFTSGQLPPGTFAPGEYTSGELRNSADYMNVASEHGSGSRMWRAAAGGMTVALASGVLTFGTLEQVAYLHQNSDPSSSYFTVQDQKRIHYGGLLEPGQYSDLTTTTSVTIAVVVRSQGLPDVIGRDEAVIDIRGQRRSTLPGP